MAIIFERNPLDPRTVRAVNSCPFDENAILIPAKIMRDRMIAAGHAAGRIRYRIFFPRALGVLRPLELLMTWLPLGAQYYACAVREPLNKSA